MVVLASLVADHLGADWPVSALGVALAWAGIGLVRELIPWTSARARVVGSPSSRRIERFRESRAADGVVGFVPIDRTRVEVDPGTSPHRRFDGFTDKDDWTQRASAAWDDGFPPLLGRVAVVSLFLGRDGKDWSSAEIRQAHRALARAGEWIEREAIRWSAAVNVDLAEVFFATRDDRPAGDTPIPLEFDGDTYRRFVDDERTDALARFSAAARSLGCGDAVELTARVSDRVEADHIVWLLHHRSAGQSIAIPGDLTDLPGVTLAVCYAREEDHEQPLSGPPFADPTTFVHELMHLFGASDKYNRSLSDFPARSVTDRDVMRLDVDSLSRLRVDPLTAAEIGWAVAGKEEPIDPTHRERP